MQSAEYQFDHFNHGQLQTTRHLVSNLKRCPLGRTIMKGWHTTCQVEDRPHFSAHLPSRLGAFKTAKTCAAALTVIIREETKVERTEKTKAIIKCTPGRQE